MYFLQQTKSIVFDSIFFSFLPVIYGFILFLCVFLLLFVFIDLIVIEATNIEVMHLSFLSILCMFFFFRMIVMVVWLLVKLWEKEE